MSSFDFLIFRFVRFLLHLASRLYFLLLLILTTIKPQVTVLSPSAAAAQNPTKTELIQRYLHYKARPLDAFTVLIMIWIAGMLIVEVFLA